MSDDQPKALRPVTAKSNTCEQNVRKTQAAEQNVTQPRLAPSKTKPVDSSRKIYDLFIGQMNPWQEELWIVALNTHLQPLVTEMIFRGTAESCPLHPRDIFRFLILANASSFAMAHNHPSGNALPSKQDETITHQMSAAGRLMEIPLVDHLVLGERIYYSFADAKRLNGKSRRSPGKPRGSV